MTAKSSRHGPDASPRQDKAHETRDPVIRDTDKTGVEDRDLEHGEGGTLGLGKPEDLRHDD